MHRQILALAALLILALGITASWAGPLIIATGVRAICKNQPGGTVTNVLVTLQAVTHNFYGTSLSYEFSQGTNVVATLSTPSTNPNPVPLLVLPPGQYNLRITTGSGLPSSPPYAITVPAFHIVTLGNKKSCPPEPKQAGPARIPHDTVGPKQAGPAQR
jgi:hypothetical protein